MSSICVNCPQLLPSDISLGSTIEYFLNNVLNPNEDKSPTLSVTSYESKKNELFNELLDINSECQQEDWDLEGAEAIDQNAISEALKFINLYPSHLPLPEIVPTPHGAIDFEWDSNEGVCNVELYGNGNLVYAGYFSDNDRDFGTKPFRNSIPNKVVKLLERIA